MDDDFHKHGGPAHLMTVLPGKTWMSTSVTRMKNIETWEPSSLWNPDFMDKACQLCTFMRFLYSLALNKMDSSCS